jgi:hypothetical protein
MVRFPAGNWNYFLHHRVQNGSGGHLASHPVGTGGGSFPGGKAAGTWSLSLTSIQCRGQRMCEAIPHSPNKPSWRGDQFKKSTGTTLPFTGRSTINSVVRTEILFTWFTYNPYLNRTSSVFWRKKVYRTEKTIYGKFRYFIRNIFNAVFI